MASSYSYDTYNGLSVVFPVVVSVVVAFFLLIATLLAIILKRCECESECPCESFLNKLMFQFVKLIFKRSLKKEEDSIVFYDYKITTLDLIPLSTITSLILLMAFTSFWASFLVDETFACDPQLDCFLRDPSLFVSSTKPLNNCTSLDYNNDAVVCFKFVFDFKAGFASAFGFAGVAALYCNVCFSILVWFSKLCNNGCCKYIIGSIIILGIFNSFTTGIFIGAIKIDTIANTNERSFLNIVYLVCYSLIGALFFYIGISILKLKERKIIV